jgi:GDPmannose 4,6-dehydratase
MAAHAARGVMSRALITGVTGQDGTYLAELLLEKGYDVHGFARDEEFVGAPHLREAVELHVGDLRDAEVLERSVRAARPDEVYNLAGMTSVAASWEHPALAAELSGVAVARLLEILREAAPDARFLQASSAEALAPRSPYGAAKQFGHAITTIFRDARGVHACNAVLYNHESPRRPPQFVTRKITWHAAAISLGRERELRLGALDVERDWGYAGDYVEGMWRMLRHDPPGDYVLATGVAHTIAQFAEVAFARVGLDWREHVVSDAEFVRPAETDRLVGDPARAERELGWRPRTSFEELVALMVDADLEALR